MEVKRRLGELEYAKLIDRRIETLKRELDRRRELVFRLRVTTLVTILRTAGGISQQTKHSSARF
jgi:hypothetical protein